MSPRSSAAAAASAAAQARLIELLEALATNESVTPSALDGVMFARAGCPQQKTQVLYEPIILFIAQGRKIAYIGGRTIVYDAHNYLVAPVPMPFECKTEASAGKPLLGLVLRVDPVMIGELLLEMEDQAAVTGVVPGLHSAKMTGELTLTAIRLLECLRSPIETRILGRHIVREILYRVLCGEQSAALRAVATRHSHFAQIGKVLRRIHADYARSLDVETLAREAGMSVSTFHANFKAVTANSPLQYLKSIRLHRARTLMVQSGITASTAAGQVGYESASQFSREFKRFFGATPVEEAAKIRAASA